MANFLKGIKLDKELVIKVGDGAWRLTKHVVKKGIQQTVMETAGGATLAMLDGNMSKVKDQFKFDNVVGPKKEKKEKTDKPKKKWFGKKKDETEEVLDEVVDATNTEAEAIIIDDADMEVVDKQK